MSQGTRERLLLTAMHLYGERGTHSVSLRAISAAAGSKNSAAMHYHFKNKQGIIEALVAFIFEHLNQIGREQKLYQRIEKGVSLNEAIRLCLLPLSELARRFPWGNDAIKLMARLMHEADFDTGQAMARHSQRFYRDVDRYLARHLPGLDAETRQLRMMFVADNIFHGFAEKASLQHTPLGDLSDIAENALLNQLVDYLAGGLQAEVNLQNTGEQHERAAL